MVFLLIYVVMFNRRSDVFESCHKSFSACWWGPSAICHQHYLPINQPAGDLNLTPGSDSPIVFDVLEGPLIHFNSTREHGMDGVIIVMLGQEVISQLIRITIKITL